MTPGVDSWTTLAAGFVVCPLAWACAPWQNLIYQAALTLAGAPRAGVWTLEKLQPSLN